MSEAAWSPDGRRIVYHTTDSGDPTFVTAPDETVGQQIYVAPRLTHVHHPIWSKDAAWIYVVKGFPPDEMDIWRIRPTGGEPERITFHDSLVAYPAPIDDRTLLYTTRAEDGSGPWLYGMDLKSRTPRRLSLGLERYTSIAASSDGRRWVATVASPKASLWSFPISERVVAEENVRRVGLASARALSPRLGPGYLLYLSSKGGADGVWKLEGETSAELWKGTNGAVSGAPAISPDGRLIAFPVRRAGRIQLHVMNADGTGARPIGEPLDVRGAPAFSPDGQWIAVAGDMGSGSRIYKVPTAGGPPQALTQEASLNPLFAPDGRYLLYSGRRVGTTFAMGALALDGRPANLPDFVLAAGSRARFRPGHPELIVLKGGLSHKNFYRLDLRTRREQPLTSFGSEYSGIGEFDVSPDGKDIVFDRLQDQSDIVLIDLPGR